MLSKKAHIRLLNKKNEAQRRVTPKRLDLVLTRLFVVLGVIFGLCILSFSATAAFNPQMNYQGKLTDSSNKAVTDGTYHMKFWLYTVESGGTAIWEGNRSSLAGNRVAVTNGLFSVLLGSSTALTSIDFDQTLYLGVSIGGTASSGWETLEPRKKLGAVPAAFVADKLDGIDSTQFLRSDEPDTMASSSASTLLTITQTGGGDILNLSNGSEVFTVLNSGYVGIGTASPQSLLHVSTTSNSNEIRLQGTADPALSLKLSFFDGVTEKAYLSYAQPHLSIVNNTNGYLYFKTNGATSMTITTDNNVGIGTTAPAHKLTVSASSSSSILDITNTADSASNQVAIFRANNRATAADNDQGYMSFYGDDDTGASVEFGRMAWEMDDVASTSKGSTLIFQTRTNNTLYDGLRVEGSNLKISNNAAIASDANFSLRPNGVFNTRGSISLDNTGIQNFYGDNGIHVVFDKGNVGIGTTSPVAKLSVTATAGQTNPIFTVASSSQEQYLTIASDGKVGIGTSSPAYPLDVYGNARVDGNLSVTNASTTQLTVSDKLWVDDNIYLKDDQRIYLDTNANNSIRYSSAHAGFVWGISHVDITSEDNMNIYANSDSDASGTWEPSFRMLSTGKTELVNTTQGNVGDRYLKLDMTDGLWITQGGLRVDAGDIRNTGTLYSTTTNTDNLIVNTGASTTLLTVSGKTWLDDDLSISTDGSSQGSPRVGAFTNLSSGEAARFQFGDEHNAFQNAYASDVNIYSYWGLTLTGGMQNYNNGFYPMPFSKYTDVGVIVLADSYISNDPSNAGNPIETFAIKATTSQWTNLMSFRDSSNNKLSIVDYEGKFSIGTDATSTYSLNVVGGSSMEDLTVSNKIGVGTTSPYAKLSVTATEAQTNPIFSVASSSESQYFTITSDGKVGIGTSSPAYPLDVYGNARVDGDFHLQDDKNLYFDTAGTKFLKYSPTHGGIYLGDDEINVAGEFQINSNTNADAGGDWEPFFRLGADGIATIENNSHGSAGSRYFEVNFTDGMRIQSDGVSYHAILKTSNIAASDKTFQFPNYSGEFLISTTTGVTIDYANNKLGIGTSSPYAKLSVTATEAQTNPIFSVASSSESQYFTITSDGKVGIGTTTPLEMLSIGGTGKLLIGNRQSSGGKLRVDLDDNDTEVQAIKTYITRTTGTNYGYNGTAAGVGAAKNVGLYSWASGATENWGLYVQSGYGIFDDRVGIGTTTPAHILTVSASSSSSILDVANTADGASNQVAIFRANNRATAADNDQGYLSFYGDDDVGDSVEFGRMTWEMDDVSSTTKDSTLRFQTRQNDTLSDGMYLQADDLYVTGTLTTLNGSGHIISQNGALYSSWYVDISGHRSLSTSNSVKGSSNTETFLLINDEVLSSDIIGPNYSSASVLINGKWNEAASGNHPLLSQLTIKVPTIVNSTSTVSDTASLYIEGAATTTVVSGQNYSLWIDDVGGGGVSRIDGKLGIGTSSPAYPLDVYGNARVDGTLKIGAYTLPSTDGATDQILKTDGSGALAWITNGSSEWTDGGSFIYPTETSDVVVIGGSTTTAPGNILEVIGKTRLNGGTEIINSGTGLTLETMGGITGNVNSSIINVSLYVDEMIEAASGNHNLVSNLYIPNYNVADNGATISNTANVYIEGALTANVLGDNYAFWVDDGISRFDGNVGIGSSSPAHILTVSASSSSSILDIANTADNASNQVAIFRANNRVTAADNDQGYLSFYGDDDTGASVEFGRMTWEMDDVSSTTKDSTLRFWTQTDNTMDSGMYLQGDGVTIDGTLTSNQLFTASQISLLNGVVRVGDGWTNQIYATGMYSKLFVADGDISMQANNYNGSRLHIDSGRFVTDVDETHPILSGIYIEPITTDNVSTINNTASLYIEGAATTTTVSGENYSLWVDDIGGGGVSRIDGKLGIGTGAPGEKLTISAGSNFAMDMAIPASPSATAVTTGSLTPDTYYFKIVALDGVGTTAGSSETSCTIAGTPTSTCSISWTASQGASSYRIYFDTTSGGEDEYFTSNTNSYSFATSTGAAAGTPPTVTTSYVNKLTASGDSWFLGGNVGIGTSSPARRFNVLDSVSNAQQRISYDAAKYIEFYVNSTGDLEISTVGEDIRALDENLWVCSGGGCGASAPADKGNVIVETALIFDNDFKLKQTSATSVTMYDSTGNVLMIFDE